MIITRLGLKVKVKGQRRRTVIVTYVTYYTDTSRLTVIRIQTDLDDVW